MKVAIVDYGMGNLGSVNRALATLGAQPTITDRPEALVAAEALVLPGVGSFADGMAHLEERGWVGAIREQVDRGKRLLGICLGMQLLAHTGTEGGARGGLNFIPGVVKRLDALGCHQRIPHVGWNSIRLAGDASRLFSGIPTGTDFYFVHSFALVATADSDVLANADYGVPFAAAVARGNVFGTQFHPEKSSKAGLRLLRNFLDLDPC